jgi:putative ribosome biogenesis GTPase RsgA
MSSEEQNSQEQDASESITVVVMGITGAGKSKFINTITSRNDIVVGDSLESGKDTYRLCLYRLMVVIC